MMKQSDEFKNNIIDNYYNENHQLNNEHKVSNEDNLQAYKEKLQISMNTMNLLNDLDFELDINIMDIIEKAAIVKREKKSMYELFGFITICILIISFIVILAFSINIKFLIYSEILFSALLPLIVIPISRNTKAKGEV